MAKVVEVLETSSVPDEYSGFNRLEVREYDNSGARHLYGVSEVDGKIKSTHLSLGKFTTAAAGAEVIESPLSNQEQIEVLQESMRGLQEQMEALSRQLDEVVAERDRLQRDNERLMAELATANNRDTNFEDTRTFKEKTSDFFRGRSLYTRYQTHPARETIVEVRDKRPKTALVVGALAVGAYLLYRYTGFGEGLSEEQAQKLIDQNAKIIDNQQNSLEIWDPNGPNVDGTAFTAIEDRIENLETIIDPNGPDVSGDSFRQLEERVERIEAKSTQDHRELHGDIHPDPGLNDFQEGSEKTGSSDEEYVETAGSTASLEYYGDTISKDVKSKLTSLQGHTPTERQIIQATQKVLEINNLNWDSARHLPVGYSYKMPNNLLELANR